VNEPDTSPEEYPSTSLSLLELACARNDGAWDRLAELCYPLVDCWCKRHLLREQDTADVFQEVMKAVLVALPKFRRAKSGAFRSWLKTITWHEIVDYLRRQKKEPVGEGGTSAQERFGQVPDPAADEDPDSAPEEDGILLRRALGLIRVHFNEDYWQAFELVVFKGHSIREAAELMRVEPDFIYQAKSRILRRLRHEFEGLLPD
jgi:RNA polymerase sigma-70 factor (ECF subfamily)